MAVSGPNLCSYSWECSWVLEGAFTVCTRASVLSVSGKMRLILSEVRGKRGRALTYGVATLSLVVVAIGFLGASWEPSLGVAAAWLIQVVAFWRLDRALSSGRNAMRAWLGGIAARLGGLVLLGSLTLVGALTVDVPIIYGISILALLLIEAGWLVRRLNHDQTDGTPASMRVKQNFIGRARRNDRSTQ